MEVSELAITFSLEYSWAILGGAHWVPCMLCFRGGVSFKIVTRPRLQSHSAGAQIVMFSIIVTPSVEFFVKIIITPM